MGGDGIGECAGEDIAFVAADECTEYPWHIADSPKDVLHLAVLSVIEKGLDLRRRCAALFLVW